VIAPRPFPSLRSVLQITHGPLLALAMAFLSISPAAARPVPALFPPVPATPPASTNTISLADYRARLQTLDQLVSACQREMTPANCQSNQVGPDVQVTLASGPRQVRFTWLRELLDRAAKDHIEKASGAAVATKADSHKSDVGESSETKSDKPDYIAPTLEQQLEDARKRLAADLQLASQSAAQPTGESSGKAPANPSAALSAQHKALAAILAAREYHPAVAGPSLRERLLEKVAVWIGGVIRQLVQAGSRSRWIGLTAEIGFVVLLCVALVWLFIRLERLGRLGPAILHSGPGSGAASARDWQLWLEDARKAAAQGAWRDAIHLTYWASISRLESSGLWPADRARTPREYLALLSPESAQRPGLATLTRDFERTWYAGQSATETDFRSAEQLAARLGTGIGAKSGFQSRDSQEKP
jgi:Domain of unknown function (DUF4129)